MTIKLRYKNPDEETSNLIARSVTDETKTIESTSNNFRFSAAVAEFGMLLRSSPYKQKSNYEEVISLAQWQKVQMQMATGKNLLN